MCMRYCGDEYGAYTLEYYATLKKGYELQQGKSLNEALKVLAQEEVDKIMGYVEQWEVL